VTFVRTVLFLCLLGFVVSGCATAPSVGVRRAYHQHTLRRVAVAPITSASRFGLTESEWQTVRATYERQILEELNSFGFRVVSPARLEHRLRSLGAWQDFTELLLPEGEIETRFEPTLYGEEPPLEVIALRKLAANSAIEADALLVTEIVYQSDGRCSRDPREFSRHAVVVGPLDGDSPCIVSHFEAKLVDPVTGETMWHNRQLRERRVDAIDASERETNIRETVSETISGPHGLGPLTSTAG
jgi:hypothetical protein